MRLYVVSDLHLEFGDFDVPEVEADVVVVAGDLHVGPRGLVWAAERLPDVPIVYVLGNHEFYRDSITTLSDRMRDAAEALDARIHVLDRGAVEIGDVVFLGTTLWTDFALSGDVNQGMREAADAMSDYRLIRFGAEYRRLRPYDVLSIHGRERRWLTRALEEHQGRRKVVVTHHPPSPSSVPEARLSDPWSPAYASKLDDLVVQSRAELWVHGHIHTPVDYRIGGTRVISNPRGYVGHEEHPGFRPDLVVEI